MLYLTLRQYEYLVAAGKSSSLTGAARALNVSQPSLSVALTRVEERLGRKVFVRGKGVPFRLTPYGRALIGRAETLLAEAARLEDPSGLDGGVPREANVGFFEDLAPRWLVPTLDALRGHVPGVRFSPVVGGFAELARGLDDGTLALALTWDLGLDGGVDRGTVARVAPRAFVPATHALARCDRVTLKRLARHPLVLFDDGLSIRHVLRLFAVAGETPRVAHRAASLEVMRSLAAHGEGVGISYANPPCDTSHDGTPLASVRIADRAAVEPVVLAWPRDAAVSLPMREIAAAIRKTR